MKEKIEREIEFHRKHLHDGSPDKKFRKGYISGLLKAWKILKEEEDERKDAQDLNMEAMRDIITP